MNAIIFNIQEYSLQDGEGIRTTIFIKGCPLKCLWCSNPEGQDFRFEIMYNKMLCKRCGTCYKVCSHNAIEFDVEGYPDFNRDICKNCSDYICTENCLNYAIIISGKEWTPEKLFDRVKTNSIFYRNSDGGVTLSGGEPLFQHKFVSEFVEFCTKEGISIGVETCGMFDWDKVSLFVDKFDFIYFDIKCVDRELHKQITGCENDTILNNLRNLSKICKDKITVSIPLIPVFTATEKNIKDIINICKINGIEKIRLIPFHNLGESKYTSLGKKYSLSKLTGLDEIQIQNYVKIISESNISCSVE